MAAVVSTELTAASPRPGTQRTHDYRCRECGYGIAVLDVPEQCPMCHGSAWEPGDWRPFSLGTAFTTPTA